MTKAAIQRIAIASPYSAEAIQYLHDSLPLKLREEAEFMRFLKGLTYACVNIWHYADTLRFVVGCANVNEHTHY